MSVFIPISNVAELLIEWQISEEVQLAFVSEYCDCVPMCYDISDICVGWVMFYIGKGGIRVCV